MCDCAKHGDLEFSRAVISKRIRESRALKKALRHLDTHEGGEHKLYRCEHCGQTWQGSRAWNWGNDEYLFRVPKISTDEWRASVYVQPDELLIFTAVTHDWLERADFSSAAESCRTEGCTSRAVSGAVHCRRHHFEMLQKIRLMPNYPEGRWFGPYVVERIIPVL